MVTVILLLNFPERSENVQMATALLTAVSRSRFVAFPARVTDAVWLPNLSGAPMAASTPRRSVASRSRAVFPL